MEILTTIFAIACLVWSIMIIIMNIIHDKIGSKISSMILSVLRIIGICLIIIPVYFLIIKLELVRI